MSVETLNAGETAEIQRKRKLRSRLIVACLVAFVAVVYFSSFLHLGNEMAAAKSDPTIPTRGQ